MSILHLSQTTAKSKTQFKRGPVSFGFHTGKYSLQHRVTNVLSLW